MNYYYAAPGGTVPIGPFNEQDFHQLINAGTVTATTLVWREGLPAWAPFVSASPEFAAGPGGQQSGEAPAPRGFCSQCGRYHALDDMIDYQGFRVCGQCKPLFFQRVREGGADPRMVHVSGYGSFWLRFAAMAVDGVIVYVLWQALNVVVMLASLGAAGSGLEVLLAILLIAVFFGVPAILEIFFVGRFGATPGKMACRLKIVVVGGGRVSYARAAARHFAKYLSWLTLTVGFIIAGSDKERRALHDHVCDTRVVTR